MSATLPDGPQPDHPRERVQINVVICTHNRARQLERVFGCLAAQLPARGCAWDVLVVDNASSDDTAAVNRAAIAGGAIPGLRYVHEPIAGLTPARRRGFAETSGEWIAFVDDDNLLEPGWISAIADAIRAHPDAGGIGGEVRLDWESEPPGYLRPFGFCFAEQQVGEADRLADNLAGAGMVLRREALVASGWPEGPLLQDRIGKSLVSGGDVEIAQRIRNAGYSLWLTPAAVLNHAIPAERMGRAYLMRINRELGVSSAVVSMLIWPGDWTAWRQRAWEIKAEWIETASTGLKYALRRRREGTEALAWAAFAFGYMRGLARCEALPAEQRERMLGAGADRSPSAEG